MKTKLINPATVAFRPASHFIDPETVGRKKAPVPIVLLYIACVALSAVGDCKMFADFGMYLKVFSLGSFALAFLAFVLRPNTKKLRHVSSLTLVFLIPLLVTLLYSMFLWSLNAADLFSIRRGVQKLAFQVITLLSVAGAAYLFDEDAADYLFYGLVIGNLLILALEATRHPLGDSLHALLTETLLGAPATSDFRYRVEIHDITFCMGFFIIYFSFRKPRLGYRWLHLLLAIYLTLVGLKRIALPGIALGLIIGMAWRKWPKHTPKVCMGLFAALILAGYAYVCASTSGVLTAFLDSLDVELSGRDKIYAYIAQFYTLSPRYLGVGFEYTTAMLRHMMATGTSVIQVTGLHNDILKLYVEMGFVGFFAWHIYMLLVVPVHLQRRYGDRAMMTYMQMMLYLWITCLTDNTMYYFFLSTSLRAMVASAALQTLNHRTVSNDGFPHALTREQIERLVNPK